MKDAQKPDRISLTTLVADLRRGRYVIPDFQREFEWKPWDIRELIRSIFLDYYIGSLLLWKGKSENFAALDCKPIYGHEGKRDKTYIVLDGQQRLTAIHYVFTAPDKPLPNRSNRFLYFIRVDRFMDGTYDEAFEYHWTRRGENLLADREAQFKDHMFPVSVLGQSGFELMNWVLGYEKYWLDEEQEAGNAGEEEKAKEAQRRASDARDFGEYLSGIMQQYQVSYIELGRDLEIDKVCDIFTQINSRGIRLDVFDLINAMLKPKGIQLRKLWQSAKPRLDFVETERTNVYLLQVMSILRQAYCSPKYLYYLLPGQEKKVRISDGSLRSEVLVSDIADFETRWHQAVDALEEAIKVLRHPREFGAISSQYLPYVSILPVFAALRTARRELPASAQLDARRKLHHWYWASVFTNRYSGSVESTSARDYLDVKEWFDDDSAEPGLIAELRTQFKRLGLRSETRRGTSVYNGIFNLLVLSGARDWMTGDAPQHDDLDDHHIVPKSWGKRAGNDVGRDIDTILNRTPLTAETNRNVIRERLPNEYLPELIVNSGEDSVRTTLESHFISPAGFDILLRKPFTANDFSDFLSERQRTIQEAIGNLLVKERLDLPPKLRELDEKTEAVELSLRRTINEALDKNPELLPSHVRQKIDERLLVAAKKNPALDNDYYQTLSGKLEYADLRELKDTMMNKGLWKRFAGTFSSKEILETRFGQLADLRNGIRHSRTVDEISRKDGEAAILWFESAIGQDRESVTRA